MHHVHATLKKAVVTRTKFAFMWWSSGMQVFGTIKHQKRWENASLWDNPTPEEMRSRPCNFRLEDFEFYAGGVRMMEGLWKVGKGGWNDYNMSCILLICRWMTFENFHLARSCMSPANRRNDVQMKTESTAELLALWILPSYGSSMRSALESWITKWLSSVVDVFFHRFAKSPNAAFGIAEIIYIFLYLYCTLWTLNVKRNLF